MSNLKMKILTVVGARPNFMKAGPIITAIHKYNAAAMQANAPLAREASAPPIDHILVHTGQHYDALMSDSFFVDLNLPAPDVHLGVGSGSSAFQTAEIIQKFEVVLLREEPDVVIVVGDVNSTLACALATAKISLDSTGKRPLLAHVEAGLRSRDRSMPEEINRILTDHVADLLFVTEQSGLENLRNEGISHDVIHFVGNTMIDSLLAFKEKAEASTILERLGLRAPEGSNDRSITRYGLLTLHRASNVDNRVTFLNILAGLEDLAADFPIIFPVHPRTRKRMEEFGLAFDSGVDARKGEGDARDPGGNRSGLILTDPLGYLDFLNLMSHAAIVVTDSGGIQEETTCLGIPCVTVRENTERPVTVERGTNIIAGTNSERIIDAIRKQIDRKGWGGAPENWDGHAATRIVDVLIRTHQARAQAGDCIGALTHDG
jgi:UDP-N-acetylglucosamine 2-epimerase (non-hydrolysing)